MKWWDKERIQQAAVAMAAYPPRLAPIAPIAQRWDDDYLHRAPEHRAMALYVQNSLLYAFSVVPGKSLPIVIKIVLNFYV